MRIKGFPIHWRLKSMDLTAIFRDIPLFEHLSGRSLRALAEAASLKSLKKKELLFREGDEGSDIFILVHGSVQLYKLTADGKEMVVKLPRRGEIFAEVVLFERSAYPVNARALEDTMLVAISSRQFAEFLEQPDFRNDFIANLFKRLRFLVDRIEYLSSQDVEERFYAFLDNQFGDSSTISISLSKKDVATIIGTTPESLSRLIARLKRAGTLSWEGDTITRITSS